jgi:hypothetical protein
MLRRTFIAAADVKLIAADIIKKHSWANVTLKYSNDYRIIGVDITARNEVLWTRHTFTLVTGDDAEARKFIACLNNFESLAKK